MKAKRKTYEYTDEQLRKARLKRKAKAIAKRHLRRRTTRILRDEQKEREEQEEFVKCLLRMIRSSDYESCMKFFERLKKCDDELIKEIEKVVREYIDKDMSERDIEVIDNFLKQEEFQFIQQFFYSDNLTWFWNETIAGENDSLNNFQFTHTFFRTRNPYLENNFSPFGHYLKAIFLRLAPMYTLRVKANLRPRTSFPHKSNWHTDISVKSLTAIFYIDTNNGYTEFKSGEIINTVENRIVIFDSNLEHRGVSCTDQKRRTVLNINYIPGELPDQSWFIPD